MQYNNYWIVVISLGIGTFIIRCSFIYLSSKITLSQRFTKVLSYIPCAVFPALFMPMAFYHEGNSQVFVQKERLLALVITMFIAYKSRSIFVTIVSGLSILFALSLV